MKFEFISFGRQSGKTAVQSAMRKYQALVQRFFEENPPNPRATATEVLARDKLFADFVEKHKADL